MRYGGYSLDGQLQVPNDEEDVEMVEPSIDFEIEDDDSVIIVDDPEEVENEKPLDYEVDQPRKKAKSRHGKTNLSAEDWISDYNASHPVPVEDPDLLRFRRHMTTIIERLVTYSCSNDGEMTFERWLKAPQGERAMTKDFRSMLSHIAPEELAKAIFDHIPDQSQQILGKRGLDLLDLLGLPSVPRTFLHRLTYANNPVHLGAPNVVLDTGIHENSVVKTIRPGVDIEPSMQTKLYIGSTVTKMEDSPAFERTRKSQTERLVDRGACTIILPGKLELPLTSAWLELGQTPMRSKLMTRTKTCFAGC
ncbi:hypothetical protein FDECE_7640 [Fusarium decemcellulare]|nr:hypothetical protein FDECE_7640 [Fusarium decemcellulare]